MGLVEVQIASRPVEPDVQVCRAAQLELCRAGHERKHVHSNNTRARAATKQAAKKKTATINEKPQQQNREGERAGEEEDEGGRGDTKAREHKQYACKKSVRTRNAQHLEGEGREGEGGGVTHALHALVI